MCLVTLAGWGDVTGMGWGSWGTLCWGCPGEMRWLEWCQGSWHRRFLGRIAEAEMGASWGDPRVLCTEGILAGQLKLKWVQAEVSRVLGAGGPLVGLLAPKLGCLRVLCTRSALVGWPKPRRDGMGLLGALCRVRYLERRWAWTRGFWGALCRGAYWWGSWTRSRHNPGGPGVLDARSGLSSRPEPKLRGFGVSTVWHWAAAVVSEPLQVCGSAGCAGAALVPQLGLAGDGAQGALRRSAGLGAQTLLPSTLLRGNTNCGAGQPLCPRESSSSSPAV